MPDGDTPGGSVKERLVRIETQGISHNETLKSIDNRLAGIGTTFKQMRENHCTPNEREITSLREKIKGAFRRIRTLDYLMAGIVLAVIGALVKVFVRG